MIHKVAPRGGAFAPVMAGRRVLLRPVFEQDRLFINGLMTHEHSGVIWRWRGLPPSGDLLHAVWPSSFVVFVVASRRTDEPIALVGALNADLLSRTCTVNYVARPDLAGTGWHLEGSLLFLTYMFRAWDMRKIYGEALSHNASVWTNMISRGVVREEGRLRQHVLLGGEYQDLVNLAVYRDEWFAKATPLLDRLVDSQAL